MKNKLFLITLVLFLSYSAVSAQNYAIHVTHNTNLRAAASLQARIVDTAPAGTILSVVGAANRWLHIDRSGSTVFMASWVGHTRIEETAPTQPQPVRDIDNCCFVDRQCNSNQEWTDGYWAFQNGQCAAPAQTQPQVSTPPVVSTAPRVSNDNCCSVDRQCTTKEEWEEGWLARLRGECLSAIDNCCHTHWDCRTEAHWIAGHDAYFSDPTQCLSTGGPPSQSQVSTQPVTISAPVNIAAPADIDNCCQVDRQCHNDDDWVRGFYDFQQNQCSSVASTASTRPITGPIPEDVDNCCFVNWQCHSEQDYVSGYERFKYNLCHVPSIEGRIRLDGSGEFSSQVKEALHLLLDKAPKWYNFVISGLHVIRERPGRSASVTARSGLMKVDPNRYPTFDLAAIIVHEACHAHRHKAGLDSGGYQGERDCTTKEIEVLRILAPGSHQLQHEEWLLANMHKTKNQWWHD
ncbi:MAG: SH3 domain-containing protein [Chloroflexi bacterium]|nr:SH3 domain-containing protein [Chloroflexota bacterium]